MRGMCVVAHPDDCVIFAYHLIQTSRDIDWTIVYLTHDEAAPRAQEMGNFWNSLGCRTRFLGFDDDRRDIKDGVVRIPAHEALSLLTIESHDFDFMLTHNNIGEYGHVHHKFVNHLCLSLGKPVIVFGHYLKEYNENMVTLSSPYFDTILLPIHQYAIDLFIKALSCNEFGTYIVPPSLQGYIGTNKTDSIMK